MRPQKDLWNSADLSLLILVHPKWEKIKDTVNQRGRKSVCEKLGIGVPTLTDIIEELQKPGRDPRDELPTPLMRSGDIMEIKGFEAWYGACGNG